MADTILIVLFVTSVRIGENINAIRMLFLYEIRIVMLSNHLDGGERFLLRKFHHN
jgi:hypothetical protein